MTSTEGNDEAGHKSDGDDEVDDCKDKDVYGDLQLALVDKTDSERDREEYTVEFINNGKVIKKYKRGFMQLRNCKRFWEVTQNV